MTTGIAWTEETWNPIVGCSIVSKGCTNCYAMQWAGQRMDGNPKSPHYAGTTKQVNGHHVWTGKLAMAPEATLLKPLRWTRPRMIFVNSMSDLFHEAVPDDWIDQVFAVMALTPQHTYQILTKRPERMREYFLTRMDCELNWLAFRRKYGVNLGTPPAQMPCHPLPNVWLGVSAEDQATADERIPLLLDTPAAVRWISAEPLLSAIDLVYLNRAPSELDKGMPGFGEVAGFYIDALNGGEHIKMKNGIGYSKASGPPKLDWIVAGGESGRDARPMHPDWVRSIRDQCADAEVPFFFKQWGEWAPQLGAIEIFEAGERSRYRWAEWREGQCDGNLKPLPDGWEFRDQPMWYEHDDMDDTQTLIRVGKKTAGDRLDGIQHHNWPVREAI